MYPFVLLLFDHFAPLGSLVELMCVRMFRFHFFHHQSLGPAVSMLPLTFRDIINKNGLLQTYLGQMVVVLKILHDKKKGSGRLLNSSTG